MKVVCRRVEVAVAALIGKGARLKAGRVWYKTQTDWRNIDGVVYV